MKNSELKEIYCDLVKGRNKINVAITILEGENRRLDAQSCHMSNYVINSSGVSRYVAEKQLAINKDRITTNMEIIHLLQMALLYLQ